MKEKLSFALKKSKAVFVIIVILWTIFSIVLIAPISICWVDTVEKGEGSFLEEFLGSDFGQVFPNIGKAFSKEYVKTFLKTEMWFTIALIGFAIIGIIRSMPKHDYAGIES